MADNFEQQWAMALKKAKTKSRMPVEARINNIKEQILLQRLELAKNIYEQKDDGVRQKARKLIQLRAKLCALQLLQIKQKYGAVNEELREKIVGHYTQDCLELKTYLTETFVE